MTISQLYRILSKRFRKQRLNDKLEQQIVDFLIQILYKRKKEVFVLIPLFNLSQAGRKRFYEEVINKIDSIGLSCIETNLIESIIEQQNSQEEEEIEMNKLKEKVAKIESLYEKKFQSFEKKMESISKKFSRENLCIF